MCRDLTVPYNVSSTPHSVHNILVPKQLSHSTHTEQRHNEHNTITPRSAHKSSCTPATQTPHHTERLNHTHCKCTQCALPDTGQRCCTHPQCCGEEGHCTMRHGCCTSGFAHSAKRTQTAPRPHSGLPANGSTNSDQLATLRLGRSESDHIQYMLLPSQPEKVLRPHANGPAATNATATLAHPLALSQDHLQHQKHTYRTAAAAAACALPDQTALLLYLKLLAAVLSSCHTALYLTQAG